MRDAEENYLRLARSKNLKEAVDQAMDKTNEKTVKQWQIWKTDDGMAILWIIVLLGFVYGMVSTLLSALSIIGR